MYITTNELKQKHKERINALKSWCKEHGQGVIPKLIQYASASGGIREDVLSFLEQNRECTISKDMHAAFEKLLATDAQAGWYELAMRLGARGKQTASRDLMDETLSMMRAGIPLGLAAHALECGTVDELIQIRHLYEQESIRDRLHSLKEDADYFRQLYKDSHFELDKMSMELAKVRRRNKQLEQQIKNYEQTMLYRQEPSYDNSEGRAMPQEEPSVKMAQSQEEPAEELGVRAARSQEESRKELGAKVARSMEEPTEELSAKVAQSQEELEELSVKAAQSQEESAEELSAKVAPDQEELEELSVKTAQGQEESAKELSVKVTQSQDEPAEESGVTITQGHEASEEELSVKATQSQETLKEVSRDAEEASIQIFDGTENKKRNKALALFAGLVKKIRVRRFRNKTQAEQKREIALIMAQNRYDPKRQRLVLDALKDGHVPWELIYSHVYDDAGIQELETLLSETSETSDGQTHETSHND